MQSGASNESWLYTPLYGQITAEGLQTERPAAW
jgi:hypothetical protein